MLPAQFVGGRVETRSWSTFDTLWVSPCFPPTPCGSPGGGGDPSWGSHPGASASQAFGVNDNDQVVGAYTDGSGQQATMHGFTWTPGRGFSSVDDPQGAGATTINGVNDHGDLVGFYTDAKGNTDGFTASPATPSVAHLHLQAMPQGTATFVWDPQGQLTVQVNAFGFTPGSSHVVELQSPQGAIIAQFSPLTANGAGQAQATLYSTDTTSVPTAGTSTCTRATATTSWPTASRPSTSGPCSVPGSSPPRSTDPSDTHPATGRSTPG